MEQLKDPRETEASRRDAAWMLGQIGESATVAIPDLIAALDREPEIRRASVVAIRQMGHQTPELRDKLMRMLKDEENWREGPSWQLPRAIVDSLVQFDPKSKEPEFVDRIVRLLNEGDSDARRSAASALREIGAGAEHAGDLIKHLDKKGDPGLASVIYALRVIAPTEEVAREVIPKLRGLLGTEQSPEVLRSVADALAQYAFHPDEETARCLKPLLLPHQAPEVRLSAADAMARLGDKARDAIADLIALSKPPDPGSGRRDPGPGPRKAAVTALGRIVRSEEGMLIEHALRDVDWQVRLAAVNAMQHLLPDDPSIVDRIALRLHDPSWEVRRSAAETLERFGDRARGAVFPLISILDDPAPQVREAAAIALGEIKPNLVAVIARTNEFLAREKDDGKGPAPGKGEVTTGTAGDEIRRSLVEDLKSRGLGADDFRLAADPTDGDAAAGGRGRQRASDKEREDARRKITEVLVDEVLRALGQPYPLVKKGSGEALKAMGSLAVPHLIDVLGRGGAQHEIRVSIIRALGGMGINPPDESGVEIALPKLAEIACGAEGGEITGAARASVQQIADDLIGYTPADSNRLDRAAKKAEEAEQLAEHPAYHPSDVTKDVHTKMGGLKAFLRGKIQPNWVIRAVNAVYTSTTEFAGNFAKYMSVFLLSLCVCLLPFFWASWLWAPLLRIKHSEWLRANVQFGIKVPGLEVKIGDFVRMVSLIWLGDRSDSALDAWADRYARGVEDVFERWEVGTAAGPQVDESRLASEFDKEKTCLLIEARDAAGQRASIRRVALWALSRGGDGRRARRMIPVLVDVAESIDAKGRRGFVDLVRGQLQALIEVADAPSPGLVEILLKRRRILGILSCREGMVGKIKDLVDQADFPANALVIIARPDSEESNPRGEVGDSETALSMRNFQREIALSVS